MVPELSRANYDNFCIFPHGYFYETLFFRFDANSRLSDKQLLKYFRVYVLLLSNEGNCFQLAVVWKIIFVVVAS